MARHRGLAIVAVVATFVALLGVAPGAASQPQPTRMGFCGGDDWEPEIASAGVYVYVVWTHFPGDPSCDPDSANPKRTYIQVSSDAGRTFGAPHVVSDRPGGRNYPDQADPTVVVSEDGTVYVGFLAWGLERRHTDVYIARSTDHGATFPRVKKINGPRCVNCDHPWPVVFGRNLYVMYAEGARHFLSRSDDRGVTWEERLILKAGATAFAEGGVADANGNAWFAWGDCRQDCTSTDFRVSKTVAGRFETTFTTIATVPEGPRCPFSTCGFEFFSPQDDIAIDASGALFLIWQDAQEPGVNKSPPIVNLSRSVDGEHWSDLGRVDDKTADGCPQSRCYTMFPRIEAADAGDIRVVWMDDRFDTNADHRGGWNVWYRTSLRGGESWTGPSVRVSQYDPSRPESQPEGFRFPYGDYQGIDITPLGTSVMVWGEGLNWIGGPSTPGHVMYSTLGG